VPPSALDGLPGQHLLLLLVLLLVLLLLLLAYSVEVVE
jgi:hypothetical protein